MFPSKWNSVLLLIWDSWIIFMTPFCANDGNLFFSKVFFLFLLFPNQLSVGWSSVLLWRWKKKALMKFPFRHIISSSLKQSHVTSHMSIVSSSSAMQCWFTDTMASHPSSEGRADKINEGLSKEKKELSVENGIWFREGRGRGGIERRQRWTQETGERNLDRKEECWEAQLKESEDRGRGLGCSEEVIMG